MIDFQDRGRLQQTCRTLYEFCKENLSWPDHLELDIKAHQQLSGLALRLAGKRFDSINIRPRVPWNPEFKLLQDVKVRKLTILDWTDACQFVTLLLNALKFPSHVTSLSLPKSGESILAPVYPKFLSLTDLCHHDITQAGLS